MFDVREIEEVFKGCLQVTCMSIVVAFFFFLVVGYEAGKSSKGGDSMVKVSSAGPVKTKKVVCSNCAYELEYTGEDVKDSSGFVMGESETSYYIVCPRESCRRRTAVKAWR